MTYDSFINTVRKHIDVTVNENTVEIVVKNFFGEHDLKLTVFAVDGVCYVHDNRTALDALEMNAGEKFEEIFEKIRKPLMVGDGTICGKLANLMNYFQILVFIANSDLIYENIREDNFHWEYTEIADTTNVQEPDMKTVIEELSECLSATYVENKGFVIRPKMIYPLNSTYGAFCMEKFAEDRIRISDCIKNGCEGAILENFYWYAENIDDYADFISPILGRFGGELDNKEIVVTAEIKDGDFTSALFRFLNLAIICSQLGQFIKLPKLI